MSKNNIISAGDTVEYTCVGGVVHPKVLRVKSDGKLILETRRKELPVYLRGVKTEETVNLSKNVCVMVHRVKKI